MITLATLQLEAYAHIKLKEATDIDMSEYIYQSVKYICKQL